MVWFKGRKYHREVQKVRDERDKARRDTVRERRARRLIEEERDELKYKMEVGDRNFRGIINDMRNQSIEDSVEKALLKEELNRARNSLLNAPDLDCRAEEIKRIGSLLITGLLQKGYSRQMSQGFR